MPQFEAAKVPKDWTPSQPLPRSLDWKGPLSPENSYLLSQFPPGGKRNYEMFLASLSPHAVSPLKFIFSGKYELGHGQSVWFYVQRSRDFGVVIRQTGAVTLTIDVKPLLNGKDCVTATTLGGNVVHRKEYGHFAECRLMEYRAQVKFAMLMAGKATLCTKFSLVRGVKVLRGNVVLKPGPRKQSTLYDRDWRLMHNNKMIYEYFKIIQWKGNSSRLQAWVSS